MLFINSWADRLLDNLAKILKELKDTFSERDKKPELKPIPVKSRD